jgi:hypothetical protein
MTKTEFVPKIDKSVVLMLVEQLLKDRPDGEKFKGREFEVMEACAIVAGHLIAGVNDRDRDHLHRWFRSRVQENMKVSLQVREELSSQGCSDEAFIASPTTAVRAGKAV